MVSKSKITLLLAAASLAAASRAEAASTFNLDLRFAPTINNQYPSNVTADGKTADMSGGGGTYTLQIWGQITDPTQDWSHDLLNAITFDIQSGHTTSTQLFTGGGVTGYTPFITPAPGATGTVAQTAVATNTTLDGVADWGNASTGPNGALTTWAQWGNASGGYAMGQTVTDANGNKISGAAAAANTWEALLGTITIDATHLSGLAGNQTFLPGSLDKVKTATSTANTNTVTLNGTATGSNVNPGSFSIGGTQMTAGVTVGSGVTFAVVPEPASLGIMMLGGLALLARRRKA